MRIRTMTQKSEQNAAFEAFAEAAARSDSIRDSDLEMLFTADAVIAQFDATDLDSGTVVEFCFPIRFDFFRSGGKLVSCRTFTSTSTTIISI